MRATIPKRRRSQPPLEAVLGPCMRPAIEVPQASRGPQLPPFPELHGREGGTRGLPRFRAAPRRGYLERVATSDNEVTKLLREGLGGQGEQERLLGLVYDELKGLARSRMAGERAQHTL